MSRRFINQISEGENIRQIFLVADKQLRANRSGNLYLQLRLIDRSGSLTGMLWNANEKISNRFESGDFLTVEGTTQFYNGAMQLIITKIDPVDANFVREEDFVRLTASAAAELRNELGSILNTIEDDEVSALMNEFANDEELMKNFSLAPAGIKNHHAFHGGLLSHVVSMLKIGQFIGDHYEFISKDLLLAGIFLHDIGKIRELSYEREFAYTDEGQLLGHIQIGAEMLDQKTRKLRESGKEISDEKVIALKHLILSHHGQPEYGAVKVPMTLEAIALHYIDNIDSKIASAFDVITQDINEGNWTSYQPNAGRKYFKSLETQGDPSEE